MDATLAGEVSTDADIGRNQVVPEERRRLILELLAGTAEHYCRRGRAIVRRVADDGTSRPGDPGPGGSRPPNARWCRAP